MSTTLGTPSRWLDCPRKSSILIEKFIAFKTPLDDRYKNEIPITKRWTCSMLIKHLKDDKKNLGLVIDLTNTNRYYRSDEEFTKKNIRYEKIPCVGHDETPNEEQINLFIRICRDFTKSNPNDIIGVHCTHGFNRTGFLICAYLCGQLDYSILTAIELFATARSPGIYKQEYIDKLIQKFAMDSPISIPAPSRPQWCLENKRKFEEADTKEPHKRIVNNYNKQQNSIPLFAVNLNDVKMVYSEPTLSNIRLKCRQMCGWNRDSFPGSQPVSLNHSNYQSIFLSPYMVSWKADGTRYLMLIESQNRIYMIDRNNNAFQVNNLYFPKDPACTQHLINTLVDGEFVTDNDNGIKRHRYLIYDIIIYNNQSVATLSFKERLGIIRNQIVNVRNEAIYYRRINKSLEPFSIRNKEFWELASVQELLSSKFQSQITHGCDGLVFQPVNNPYQPGRSDNVFKWKEDNTIDFLLKIERIGETQDKSALLFVHGMSDPFASIRYSPELDQYKNQIIECSYTNHEWHFYRHRADKSFPNARETATRVIEAIQHPVTKDFLCSVVEEHIAFSNY